MCIAIAKQAGVAITEEILETCFNANPDGAGFAIEKNGKLQVHKGYFSFKDFMDAYEPHELKKALIHFRIKTHGKIDEENCHPFYVTDNLAFIHNGIISNARTDTHKSDTRTFKEDVLQPFVAKFGYKALTDPIFQHLIEKYIGGSKLVLMRKGQPDFIFFNKQMGNESEEGIWFSNYSWQKAKPVTQPPVHYGAMQYYDSLDRPSPYWKRTQGNRKEIGKLEIWNGTFSFGTVVRVKYDIQTEKGLIDKGAVGEVETIWSDNTMEIDFYPAGVIDKISPYALEIIDTAESFFYNEV